MKKIALMVLSISGYVNANSSPDKDMLNVVGFFTIIAKEQAKSELVTDGVGLAVTGGLAWYLKSRFNLNRDLMAKGFTSARGSRNVNAVLGVGALTGAGYFLMESAKGARTWYQCKQAENEIRKQLEKKD